MRQRRFAVTTVTLSNTCSWTSLSPEANIVADCNSFISAKPMPEQAQIPTRKITATIYPTIQKPETAVEIKSVHIGCGKWLANFASSSGVMRSSASMISTQSSCQGTFSTPNSSCRGSFPFHANFINPSPCYLRDRLRCSSVLPESTHHDLCANETLARQSRKFAASFLTGTSTRQRRPRFGLLAH